MKAKTESDELEIKKGRDLRLNILILTSKFRIRFEYRILSHIRDVSPACMKHEICCMFAAHFKHRFVVNFTGLF